jgi:hypothetical protein
VAAQRGDNPWAKYGIDLTNMAEMERISLKMRLKRIVVLEEETVRLEQRLQILRSSQAGAMEIPKMEIFAKIINRSTNRIVVIPISTTDPAPAVGNSVAAAIGRRAKLSIRTEAGTWELDDASLTRGFQEVVVEQASAITIIAG